MIIRKAVETDVPAIVSILTGQFHEEFAGTLPSFNLEKVFKHVIYATRHGRVLLAEDGGEIIGSLGFYIESQWYSDDPFFCDLWFYVSRHKRASRAAVELLKSYKSCAEEAGLPATVGVATADDLVRKDRFFERMGFKRLGGFYRREV
jgi:N-acetylglutamate synthase-like GNAT family acetyltransferase